MEKFSKPDAWKTLSVDSLIDLAENVAGLPSELESDGEEAKRFDLLILNLQLAILKSEPSFERLCEQIESDRRTPGIEVCDSVRSGAYVADSGDSVG